MEKSWKKFIILKKYDESFADFNKALEITFESKYTLCYQGMVCRETNHIWT